MMKVIVLGSGTNVPSRRAAAGYLVKTDTNFVMDFGYRTFYNLSQVTDRKKISHILISHLHPDHYEDFIPFFQNAVYESKKSSRKDVTVIGPPGTKRLFSAMLNFPSFDGAKFKTRVREIPEGTFSIGKTKIVAKKVDHVPYLHCLGYRIEYSGKAIAYSGDAVLCEALVELCRNCDVAILDCSFPKNHPTGNHLGAINCGKVASEAGVKKLVLSHLYPACNGRDMAKECREVFNGEVIIAEDLMKITSS